ncbi:hypothetical protein LIER_41705 [Lithospermum erythrorhizon]|uniref:Uncharacterized protein n=1 Tax=Lithospermum erythrorhizon TaxID=34254 RepID=A0AAV3RJ58_LITER
MITPNLDDLVGILCVELITLEKENKENEEKDDEMSKETKGEQHVVDPLENFVTLTFQLAIPLGSSQELVPFRGQESVPILLASIPPDYIDLECESPPEWKNK